jgi:ribonuclease-3
MKNRNVLAALLEASLAGLFLEHGFEKIERAIVDAFSGRIEYALTSHVDYKTELQEALARRGKSVSYAVLNAEGAPHDRTFTCSATVDGEQLGVGHGRSKKAAEQAAAQQVLAKLGVA